MPAKKRRLIANDNVAQFQRQFLSEYDEIQRSVLVASLAKEKGPEHRDLRDLRAVLDALK